MTDRTTHFVPAGQQAVDLAKRLGATVTAACGTRLVPTGPDDVHPLCPSCLEEICTGWAA